MQKRTFTIAEAVAQLIEPGLTGLIVTTLHDWIRGDEPDRLVTRHAARATVRIALIPAAGDWHNPPVLLTGLAGREFEVRSLGVLWHAALCGESTRSHLAGIAREPSPRASCGGFCGALSGLCAGWWGGIWAGCGEGRLLPSNLGRSAAFAA